ncbi:MAG: type IV secretion system protein [Pelagimonas sp.]|jgi:type IV secretion system protein VirB6|uniref:type IV secretion system protein n=1 Tax=Pelagimonas sp. TaxID=2073170 RepID=UPI003D6B7A58
MSVVTYFVETAEGYLNTAAETQFGSVAATVGTLINLASIILVIMVFINMAYQYRSMDGRTAFWLAIKITLVGVFALNWTQFNSFATAILNGIDSIAGALVASVGGGTPGPSGTFSEEFDSLIASLGDYLNAAGSELNWMAGAMLDILGVLLLSILGGLAAFILVASRLMIALLIGMAPIMIFLTLFEVTKDYFARWLSALISFALYPVVVAGVFATITGVSRALLGELGDPEGASNIGALIPFFMMVLMAKGFIIATPFIVRAISGNIVMPALTSGMGGAYAFGRALGGSQQAYNRMGVGTASGAEVIAIRTRQAMGLGRPSETINRQQPANNQPAPPPQSTGTGQQMERMKARSDRLKGK